MGGGTGGEGQIDGARRWCRNATAKSASNGTMKRVLPEHHFVTLEDKLFLNMGVYYGALHLLFLPRVRGPFWRNNASHPT